MKRRLVHLFLLLSFGVLTVSFSSCGKASQNTGEEDTLDRIRRTGIIEACTVINPPFVIKNAKSGNYSGLFVDALNVIAKKMNANVNWHETTYANAAGELQSQRCDLVVTDMFATIPRADSMAFIEPPVGYEGLTLIIRKGDPRMRNIKNISQLDQAKYTISVATGSGSDIFVTQNFHKAQIKRIDVQGSDTARHIVEVTAHRADAAMFNMNFNAAYVRRHPETAELFHDHPFYVTPISWTVRPDDFKWLQFMETALQFMDTQGTLAQLEKKYGAHWMQLAQRYQLQ